MSLSLPTSRPKGTAYVRNSKYRHVFGAATQQSEWLMNLKVGACQSESTVIKANSKYLAIPWNSTGCVGIFPTDQKGAISTETPVLFHEDNAVNDLEFHLFEENLLFTATNSGAAYIWNIPEGGVTKDINTPLAILPISDKRLLSLDFHPLAANVLLGIDASKKVKIWDVDAQKEQLVFPDVHKAVVSNVSWNYGGSLVATACKDKMLRIFDPRANSLAGEVADHDGAKGFRVLWLTRKDLIFTAGFSKGSERQISIFDPRKLSTKLSSQKIDSSSSTLLPFADQDNNLVFLAGKGDGNIRYYEVNDEAPYFHYINEFKSKDPQSGLAALPKRCCDVMKCEIIKFLKLTPNGNVVQIRFEVPRAENQFFQDDIFPDTPDGKASMTSSEWFGGANNPPNLISLDPKKS